MADDAATSAEETQLTFNVKGGSDQKYVITMSASATVADLKSKLATPEFADVPADRQRLIYSGRVLKDADVLSSTKLKDGHTVHLVKGAASNVRQNPANQGTGSSTPTPQVPTNLATGTGNNPLAGLTGARYAGFHGLPGAEMFGPDGGMGPPPNPDRILEMMDNPMVLSQMQEAMNNPAAIEMMLQNPMIRDNPMLADMIRNPEMRRMLFDPASIRMQLQMQRAMGGGAGERMAAPGVTDTTPQPSGTATGEGVQANTGANPADPLAALFGGAGAGGAGANPFANLFGPQGGNSNNTSQTTGGASSPPPPTPFGNLFGTPQTGADGQQQANPIAEMTRQMMQNPEAMRAAMNMFQGGAGAGASPFGAPPAQNPGSPAAANPFAALFGPGGFPGGFPGAAGMGSPAPPQDTRPPEEVYEVQLRQLNEMGFFEFERNVSALRRSGGNVQGAIEFLLGGGS